MKMARQNVKIVSVDPVSIGAYVGTFYALLGAAVGIILAFGTTFKAWFGDAGYNFFEGLGFGLVVGLFGIVLYPVIYFVIGMVQGWIFGFIFNAVTGTMGGIKIETE